MLNQPQPALAQGLQSNFVSASARTPAALRFTQSVQNLDRTVRPHGISTAERDRLTGGFVQLRTLARSARGKAGIYLISARPSGTTENLHDLLDRLRRAIGQRQRQQGLTAAYITVLEADPEPHAHLLALLPVEPGPLRCRGLNIDIRPADDGAVHYLLKETTPEAWHAIRDRVRRKRGSHRLPGGGDRVRLSPELRDQAIAANRVLPHRATYAKRTAERQAYPLRRLFPKRAPRPAGQAELPLGIRQPARLAEWSGGKMPAAVWSEAEFRRNRLGLTQSALAQRIGIRQPHLSNVLRGHDPLAPWPAARLREVLLRGPSEVEANGTASLRVDA
jgi:hypothetical protein